MYRKCTVDLVPKSGFRLPNADGVNGRKKGHSGNKKPRNHWILGGFKLVAGDGFEPPTFRL